MISKTMPSIKEQIRVIRSTFPSEPTEYLKFMDNQYIQSLYETAIEYKKNRLADLRAGM